MWATSNRWRYPSSSCSALPGTRNALETYLRLWAAREFGSQHAADIAELVANYTKYNGRRKPELLDPDTFSLVNYGEADRVVAEWQTLRDRAEAISVRLA